MEQAISLNNEGADLLVVKDQYSNASALFKRALETLKSECRRRLLDQRAREQSLSSCGSKTTSAPLMVLPAIEAPLSISETTLPTPDLQDDNLGHYIYNHGIFIRDAPPRPSGSRQDGEEEPLSHLSVIVIFNLALLSHGQGKCGCKDRFKVALSLYAMAAAILKFEEDEDTFWPTLKLLILNNMAHIHFELLEYNECQSRLLDVVKLLENDVPIHAAFEHVNAEGILLNVMLLNQPTEAQAA